VKPKVISFLPAFILFLISFVLLVLPGSDIPKSNIFELIYFDKWVHIGMFGLLVIVWSYPFLKTGTGTKNIFGLITLAVIFYGVVMEFVQKYFAYQRSFDLIDILADATGAIFAFIFMVQQLKKFNRDNLKKNEPL